MFSLLYKHTDDGVFNDFLKSFEDFPKLSWSKARRTFPNIFRKFPKIAEDFRERPEDVSIIHHLI